MASSFEFQQQADRQSAPQTPNQNEKINTKFKYSCWRLGLLLVCYAVDGIYDYDVFIGILWMEIIVFSLA